MKRGQMLGIAVVAVIVVAAGAYFMRKAPETGGGTPATQEAAKAGEHRGGTMRLVAVGAGGTIDPQINYTLQYWQLYQGLYDGLLNFKKGTGDEGFKVVPDIAEDMPQVADDGKTLVFKIRKGLKFSNGQELTTKDVVASFQRIFKVSSPTAGGFYAGIVGADKCLAEPATCTLEGGVVADEAANTVTLHLTQPDAEIYYKLAVPHAVILPADSPAKDVGTAPLPGTGAYMIESYDPNKQLKIVRNPHFKEWSKDAQPDGYPDVVVMDFGLTDEAEVTAVANDQADWAFDPPPADRLAEIGTKYKDQVHVTPLTAMWYAPMNVNIPPFNNEKARQAVSYAIDRAALVKLFGGDVLASPVCQILPPGFPGHVDYCPYTKNPEANKWSAPDMDKAKALMQESGQIGQPVTVISEDSAVSKSVGTYLQSVLNELGFKAELKPISSNIQFTYIQNTNNKVQISVTQWYQDYPAASDFLNILFGCDSFHEGSDSSVNIAGFCDKEIDAKMKEAMKVAVTDPKKADGMWAEIDKAVTDKAAAAILFTPKHVDFVSKRLGNFQFNPQYYFMVYQAWVQ
ncbi:ABC transporter substrate-binding protein [Dongia sp.]|uniref:ABC transporter substrate-binding protein n=1 Tax=Dongia sp. TaxID=1977262 RepID=UPI003751C1D3